MIFFVKSSIGRWIRLGQGVQIWNSASSPKELQKRAGKCKKVLKKANCKREDKKRGQMWQKKNLVLKVPPGRAILIWEGNLS
jgi:hypothetical protein